MSKIFLSCEEASHVCDKAQYKESTLWERIKFGIHILFCTVCRKHSVDNQKLTKAIEKSKIACLDKKSKSEMKTCIEQELKKTGY
ncbi:hypothetical protein FNB79_07155 [Formosa sediminum]|uniref:Glycine dehydrogenase n=1 Tax=Formosa sediminum TaxID=2594004 RepID=A0A516GQJ6_9FLAO|nr:hypothetical protein [Formosa sediminum]QDO93763.1 hypothetical protein FNB79_07155 [Formosa sediminum]